MKLHHGFCLFFLFVGELLAFLINILHKGVSDTSFESGMSDDYAVPPDALSCDTTSLESSLILRASYLDSPKKIENLEKSGSLAKLGKSTTFCNSEIMFLTPICLLQVVN